MSLSTTTDRVAYSGNDVTTAFSFPYKFFAEADLVVILKVDSTGVETVKTLTTHYTTTGAGIEAGGTVTMLTAPVTGETLILYRDKSAIQELELTENGKIPSDNLEKQLDKLAMMVQRIKNTLARSVRLPEGYTGSLNPKLPAVPVASSLLAFDADALNLVNGPTVTAIATAVSGQGKTIVGTRAVPTDVVAATGIVFSAVTWTTTNFIQGSGGAVVVTAAPRIQAGTIVGQRLELIGRSDASYVDLSDGNGIITGGQTIRFVANTIAVFIWDGTNWVLESTNGLM